VSLEEILRQFQAQGMGGGGARGAGGAGGRAGARAGAGAGGAGMPGGINFDLKGLLSNLNPQMVIYALPLLFVGLQVLSSVVSLVANYWYMLLIIPLVPAQYRKQVVIMAIMYSTMGGMVF
jgi:hypothetical protein